jgi:hypothetical protein
MRPQNRAQLTILSDYREFLMYWFGDDLIVDEFVRGAAVSGGSADREEGGN